MCFAFLLLTVEASAQIPDTVRIDTGLISGVHAAEGILVFKGIPFAAPPVGDLRWRAPQPMASYWANFAATGDPNGRDLPEWPVYEPSKRTVLELGDTVRTRTVLDDAKVDFYDDRAQHSESD